MHGDILDLVYSNETRLSAVKSDVVIVARDTYHPALEIKLAINSELPLIDHTHEYFDFRHANYTKISMFLNSFNWLETIWLLDVNSSTDALYDALHFCVLSVIPKVICTSSKFPHWFSKNLKSIVFSKKVTHAKYKTLRCPLDYNAFSYLRNRYKFEYKNCYKSFLFQTENKLKQNPRTF